MHAMGVVNTEEYPLDWTAVEYNLRSLMHDENAREKLKNDPRAALNKALHETQRPGSSNLSVPVPGFVLDTVIPPKASIKVLEPTTDEIYLVLPQTTRTQGRGRRRKRFASIVPHSSPSVRSALGRITRFGGEDTAMPQHNTFAGMMNGKFVIM